MCRVRKFVKNEGEFKAIQSMNNRHYTCTDNLDW